MCNTLKKFYYVTLHSDKDLSVPVNNVEIRLNLDTNKVLLVLNKSTDLLKSKGLITNRFCFAKIYKENDYEQFYKIRKGGKNYYFKLPYQSRIDFTQVNSDVNGNSRYVCHYLNLLTDKDEFVSLDRRYNLAVKRANKIGGKKFHNESYGGGIVFQTSLPTRIERLIKELLKEFSW